MPSAPRQVSHERFDAVIASAIRRAFAAIVICGLTPVALGRLAASTTWSPRPEHGPRVAAFVSGRRPARPAEEVHGVEFAKSLGRSGASTAPGPPRAGRR
jgi:hypothetical protein